MVKNTRATPQVYSLERSPSQGSQETHEVALRPITKGRKSQRYLREKEAEREMELGRQRSLEEMKLLQHPKNLGGARTDGRSRVESQSVTKC